MAGKGGVGKTTIVALLALEGVRQGYRVWAVDADPAATLGATLGIAHPPRPLAELSDLIARRVGQGGLVKLNPNVDDIPDHYSVEKDGVRLLVLGAIRTGGAGCACPENTFLRALLRHLLLRRDEAVFVDMEAGIEHLGRGTVEAVDALLVVVEPDLRSLETAQRIVQLAKDLGLERWAAVANKVRSPEDLQLVERGLPQELCLVAVIPYAHELAAVGRGLPLPREPLAPIQQLFAWASALAS